MTTWRPTRTRSRWCCCEAAAGCGETALLLLRGRRGHEPRTAAMPRESGMKAAGKVEDEARLAGRGRGADERGAELGSSEGGSEAPGDAGWGAGSIGRGRKGRARPGPTTRRQTLPALPAPRPGHRPLPPPPPPREGRPPLSPRALGSHLLRRDDECQEAKCILQVQRAPESRLARESVSLTLVRDSMASPSPNAAIDHLPPSFPVLSSDGFCNSRAKASPQRRLHRFRRLFTCCRHVLQDWRGFWDVLQSH